MAMFMDRSRQYTVVSTEMPLFVDRSHKLVALSTKTAHSVDRAGNISYASPTNAKVATLILTDGGNTVRRATRQAWRVAPVVNTSSISRMCRTFSLSDGVSSLMTLLVPLEISEA